jgi:hypothetical protein
LESLHTKLSLHKDKNIPSHKTTDLFSLNAIYYVTSGAGEGWWTDRVRNEEVFLRVKEQRNYLH